jgi:hypothetical protein
MISKQFLSNLIHASNICLYNLFVKVLVVQEKHCSSATLGLWKIPTGFIHEVCMYASRNFPKCSINEIERCSNRNLGSKINKYENSKIERVPPIVFK